MDRLDRTTRPHGVACACLACDRDPDDHLDAKARSRAAESRTTAEEDEPPC